MNDLTTSDIKKILYDKLYLTHSLRRVNNEFTIEIQNAHFICDKDYIISPNIKRDIEFDWYVNHYMDKLFENEQYHGFIRNFEHDKHTREGVLFFSSSRVYKYDTHFSCTMFIQCFVNNDNKLDYIVNMRSSDVIRFVNDMQFHHYLQNQIINSLQLNVDENITAGNIYWNAGSLHILENDFKYLLENGEDSFN